MNTLTAKDKDADRFAAIKKHGITIDSEFVRWSLSRNAGEKSPSLNWKVTVKKNGRAILTADYMAGLAHCPSYKQGEYNTVDGRAAVLAECESGKAHNPGMRPILPNSEDVIYSLLMDSEVLDCATYEDWAANLGYNEDSRSGEAIYRACLEIALKLRAALGDSALAELREAFQDF